jgi:integrase
VCEYHFSLHLEEKGKFKQTAMVLGTLGNPFTDAIGVTRPFTIDDARAMRNAARLIVKAGLDPRVVRHEAKEKAKDDLRNAKTARDARQTFRQVFNDWKANDLKHVEVRNGKSIGRKDDGKYVQEEFERWVFPRLDDGNIPFVEVRKANIVAIRNAAKLKGRISTANMVLADLKQMFKYATEAEIIDASPIQLMEKLPGEVPRERNLTDDEIKELYQRLPNLPERMRHIIPVLLATAVRVSELAAAEVEHFDLEKREWSIPVTKNQKAHLVHLSDHAIRHIKALMSMRGASAFLLPAKDPKKPMTSNLITKSVADRQRKTAIKTRTPDNTALRLGSENWTPHDLRRTAATVMGRLKVAGEIVELTLNHAPPKLKSTYQRDPRLAERRDAFNKLGNHLDALVPGDAKLTASTLPIPVLARRKKK